MPGEVVPLVDNGELALEKPTLSTFSLACRVCVVTGGAQGLGLVMSRALVIQSNIPMEPLIFQS
jgi:hypothetical protein